MSSDAYSPLTGRWGVEGMWDIAIGGIALATLGLLLLLVGTVLWSRVTGCIGVLAGAAALDAVNWLNEVTIAIPGDAHTYCLMGGPVDAGTECGAAYLTRYWSTFVPTVAAIVVLLSLVVIQIRVRLANRTAALVTSSPD